MNIPNHLRAPLIWITILAAGLIWLFLPLAMQPYWILVFGAVLAIGLGIIGLSVHRQRRLRRLSTDVQLSAMRELPVVLIVGPYAAAAFPRSAQDGVLRREGHAVWLLVKTPEELAATMSMVKESHGRFPDAALMPVLAEGNPDDAVMRREFTQWRRALEETSRNRACVLPCYPAIYACLGARDSGSDKSSWFGDVIDMSIVTPSMDNARQRLQMIRRQLDQSSLTSSQPGRLTRDALGQSVLDWLEDTALLSSIAPLANTAPFALHGLLLADIGYTPTRAGSWTRWLVRKTGLQPPATSIVSEPLPLPEVIPMRVAQTKEYRRIASRHATQHAVAAMAVVLAASFFASGWKNSQMVERIASDLKTYWDTPDEQFNAKRELLGVLRGEYAEVQQYAKGGVPVGLGWGLYKGGELQSALERAIAAYRPPPVVLTLDSLSLFDSGKTSLKAGASQKLQDALKLILSNPDKRILIAGHTDNIGSSDANLKLSEARAKAIRDWFVAESSLPVTLFAIQGYGDTRPLASNRDAAGRARNRRVEITLVPDVKSH
ncbi:OmpA family protein [Trinickia terrae]|uniref:OmpA family protein n=1 Tax=Trinickia terrae TaxID=2571161 RepID=A0A4U1I7Q0_9BURK|nr:OmpA family protein [Trinickia terrae]TKC89357.1 OmpA family protein [Trinickia terrae]